MPRSKPKQKPNLVLILIAAIAIVAVAGVALAYQGGYLRLASMTPGFEGLQFYIDGFSTANLQQAVPTGTQLPAPFSWLSSGAYQAVIQAHDITKNGAPAGLPSDWYNFQDGKLNIQLSYTSTDTSNPIQEVDYYVLQSSTAHNVTVGNTVTTTYTNTYEHVVGYVVPAYFTMNVFSVPGSGEYDFQGQQIWLVGQTEVWNHAMIDPTNPNSTFQAANSIPIAAVINSYTLNGYSDDGGNFKTNIPLWVSEKAQMSPQNNGQPLTFYTNATTAGANPSSIYLSPSLLLTYAMNQSLAGDIRPDTRFSPQVFTPITLVDFGGSDDGYNLIGYFLGMQHIGYPSVTYNIKIYYLELGTFIFSVNNAVNSTLPNFQSQNTTISTTIWGAIADSISSWLSSPLVEFGLILTVIIVGIIAVVIFLVFTNIGRAADKVGGQALNKKGGKK
jgi:hypothetical protein